MKSLVLKLGTPSTIYFFADAPMKKKNQKFCIRGFTALFIHQVQNNFFSLIKKIFLQTLVEIIFRYQKIFF